MADVNLTYTSPSGFPSLYLTLIEVLGKTSIFQLFFMRKPEVVQLSVFKKTVKTFLYARVQNEECYIFLNV